MAQGTVKWFNGEKGFGVASLLSMVAVRTCSCTTARSSPHLATAHLRRGSGWNSKPPRARRALRRRRFALFSRNYKFVEC